ncbi:MAG: hypothetical protein GC152_15770 [Alphaproteobacteria bacterium]|nr:hypothetical protein [Alphaproteobacteria bacterium]
MVHDDATSSLLRLRADLAADIRHLEQRQIALRRRLKRLDDDLRLLGAYSEDVPPPCRPNRRLFRRNELKALVCSILREIGDDASNRTVALIVIERIGITGYQRKLEAEMVQRVRQTRNRLAARQ